jgi:hypothetical protein
MKLIHLAQALLSLAVIASPFASSALDTSPEQANVRVGNGSDALLSRPSNIRDDDSVMVILDSNEMATLRIVGKPGQGQPSAYTYFRCQPHPKGGLYLRSCVRQGKVPLNQTAEMMPGYYILEYAGSTHHLEVKEGDQLELKLMQFYYPESLTSAGLKFSVIRDMTNPIEFDKLVREVGGMIYPEASSSKKLVDQIASFRPCDREEFRTGKPGFFMITHQGDRKDNSEAALKAFYNICQNRDRTTALLTMYEGQNLIFKPTLGPTLAFFPDLMPNYNNAICQHPAWMTGEISTAVTSSAAETGQFISVFPGAYAVGSTRGDVTAMSYKPGYIVTEKLKNFRNR